ncbi:putative reverse transcriptase zinc-binding domain-containing protein [Helianthus annuus]|nr:putative reverse transcriptase zinc-binding domain-containing protein [Helianthus annuus]
MTLGQDMWKWTADPDGCFSVKSVKRLLKKDVEEIDRFVVDWNRWVPAKVNIHVWRLGLNRVPTSEALLHRNIEVSDPSCLLCGSETESADHLFLACYVASMVWNGVSSWCKITQIFAFSFQDLFSIHNNLMVSEKKRRRYKVLLWFHAGVHGGPGINLSSQTCRLK